MKQQTNGISSDKSINSKKTVGISTISVKDAYGQTDQIMLD